jgi:para-aminobenzoate synthetase component 1
MMTSAQVQSIIDRRNVVKEVRPVILTSMEDWEGWVSTYTVIPYVQQFSLKQAERIPSWEKAWESASDCSFVLESGKMGRYSFMGLHPVSTIKGKGDEAVIQYQDGTLIEQKGSPLTLVKEWMNPYKSPKVDGSPKFVGGCVGYWGYDVVRSIEHIPIRAEDDLPYPDYYFMMLNELWIIDHEENALYCACHIPAERIQDRDGRSEAYASAGRQAARMKEQWDKLMREEDHKEALRRAETYAKAAEHDKLHIDVEAVEGIQTVFKKEDYMEAVRQIQRYISQGDVFQVNLSLRQSRKLRSTAEDIYEWLRLFNPSPYMGFLRFPEFKLVSASPELLVKLENDEVSTRPIAGTRRRGMDAQEDSDMAAELLLSEKERSEHIMLVDLERNDLGKISRYGSVRVSDFMVIEYYSHVMHIVSEVQGKLMEGKDAYDIIAAAFPGGTITGAPKIRTMEIIEELEPVRRGPYTGSIGWIDYNGNMEFNIIIRTLVISDQMGHIQAGAGIVIDSDPLREYHESLNKAKALWKAIQYSELMISEAGRN